MRPSRTGDRAAGQLYAAWRDGSAMIRKGIPDESELFSSRYMGADENFVSVASNLRSRVG